MFYYVLLPLYMSQLHVGPPPENNNGATELSLVPSAAFRECGKLYWM